MCPGLKNVWWNKQQSSLAHCVVSVSLNQFSLFASKINALSCMIDGLARPSSDMLTSCLGKSNPSPLVVRKLGRGPRTLLSMEVLAE